MRSRYVTCPTPPRHCIQQHTIASHPYQALTLPYLCMLFLIYDCASAPGSAVTYEWTTGPWGDCTSNVEEGCDAVIETRLVLCKSSQGYCADEALCTGPKPSQTRPCTLGSSGLGT